MTNNQLGLSCLTLLFLLLPLTAIGKAISNCKVSFRTKGQPVLVTIEGESENPCSGEYTIDPKFRGEFIMPLDKLDTGIPLRNKHLRDNYLHTSKFPNATLVVEEAEAFSENLKTSDGKESKFTGVLELHGQKKPTTDGLYSIKNKKVRAKFSVLLPDHGVEQPAFMGIKVVDRVYIEVEFDAHAE